jgi:hypothetical protein
MFKERDEAERAKVEKLVGSFRRDYNNKPTDTGIPIFLKLKIVRIDTQKQIIILGPLAKLPN